MRLLTDRVPNRLAVDGEVLVVHRFCSGSLGRLPPTDCDLSQCNRKPSFWTVLRSCAAWEAPLSGTVKRRSATLRSSFDD